MKTYRFTIFLKDVGAMTEDIAESLYVAGCDDSSPGSHGGQTYAAFDRDANSLESAVASAVANVRSAGYAIDRVQIDESDLAVLSAGSV